MASRNTIAFCSLLPLVVFSASAIGWQNDSETKHRATRSFATRPFNYEQYVLPSECVPEEKGQAGWQRFRGEGFDWRSGSYGTEYIWSGDGRWLFFKNRGVITQVSVADGRCTRQTKMPSSTFGLYSSRAGLAVLFLDIGRYRGGLPDGLPTGLLLLDAETLQVKAWYPQSVFGFCASVDSDLVVIAARTNIMTSQEARARPLDRRAKETGQIHVFDLSTGHVLASGELRERSTPLVRHSYRGRPAMRLALTDHSTAIFTDGVGELIRYQVQGDCITFDRSYPLIPRPAAEDGFVDIWSYCDEYLVTNFGIAKTSAPTTFLDPHVVAVTKDGWSYHLEGSRCRIDHPYGNTIHTIDWNRIDTGGASKPYFANVTPGPSCMPASFLIHSGDRLVVARPLAETAADAREAEPGEAEPGTHP